MAEDAPSSSSTPLTPPLDEEDRLSWLRLLRSRRVGVATFYRLLAEHGSADAALEALPEIAQKAGVKGYMPCTQATAADEFHRAKLAGAQMICRGEAAYPALLNHMEDAPPFLWAIGDLTTLGRPMIAMVGARSASSLGLRTARRLAAGLVEAGFTVVSGLARGIDGAAHEAALSRGGQGATLAVHAGGADVVYPAEHAALAQEISERGLRVSEAPIGLVPHVRHFPPRNRIVAGLSRAVVVIEAAAKSGTLITARAALDIGRDVLAVPGHPFDGRAAGCNFLIRDGATLVRDAKDVLEVVGTAKTVDPEPSTDRKEDTPDEAATVKSDVPATQCARQKPIEAHALHQRILDRLGPSPLAEDQLIRDLGASAGTVGAGIVELEILGQIRRQPGGLLSLADVDTGSRPN
ncbi:MAG: DNA-processing protein DprA [Pseudomonadota bacterium]